ncbi:unnamed protein product [Notodromas monacha]|uniref:Potassium channel domain-containing protein n=1 Tax=Notodromas monacha TaxID=399045 RepID=A0A7R9GBH7_9CRUS|nr:unnamed protein product [Notodromas monacha]CAG0916531.1 unnamed protein product [Notodromas monacha]
MAIDLNNDHAAQRKKAKRNEEPAPFWKLCLRFAFSHVGLFLLVGAYATLGAYLFISLELPFEEYRYEVKKVKAQDVDDSIRFLADHFEYFNKQNLTSPEWKTKVINDLTRLKKYIVSLVDEYQYDGDVEGWTYSWTFGKALLFTISIMTTIGYGHIAPDTFNGQIFVIIYAIIGVPLMLMFLANIGDTMATWLKYTYSRGCCRWCRSRRKESELPPGIPKNSRGYRLMDEEVGPETYMPTDDITVPIVLNLVILSFYIVMGGLLFSLALVSMAINLIQDQVVQKMTWVAKEVGISNSDEPRIPLSELRQQPRTQNTLIMETPKDLLGKATQPRSASKRSGKEGERKPSSQQQEQQSENAKKARNAESSDDSDSSDESRPGSAASQITKA